MKQAIYSLTFAVISLSATSARGQSLERQVIGSAGAYSSASWGSLSATAGESVINTSITPSLVLTQGFQQPLQSDLGVVAIPANDIAVKVFPVPAADVINVVISSGQHYTVTLFDLPGQQLKLPYRDQSNAAETNLVFDVRSIANGSYYILISDAHNQQLKTIKFTKIN